MEYRARYCEILLDEDSDEHAREADVPDDEAALSNLGNLAAEEERLPHL